MFSRCLPRSSAAAWFGWCCVAHRCVFPLVVGSLVDDTGRCTRLLVSGSRLFDVLPEFMYADFFFEVTSRIISACSMLGATADTCSSQSTEAVWCFYGSLCIWQSLVRCWSA